MNNKGDRSFNCERQVNRIVSQTKEQLEKLNLEESKEEVSAETRISELVNNIRADSRSDGSKKPRHPRIRIIPLGSSSSRKISSIDSQNLKKILETNNSGARNLNSAGKNITVEVTSEPLSRSGKNANNKRDADFDKLLALCKHNIMSLYHERTKKSRLS